MEALLSLGGSFKKTVVPSITSKSGLEGSKGSAEAVENNDSEGRESESPGGVLDKVGVEKEAPEGKTEPFSRTNSF